MEATLLGTSDAYGVPAPLCDCEYCLQSSKRYRPSVVVQSGGTTIVLDAGPDIKSQLHHEGVFDVDAFYLTHHHFDHGNGMYDLFHITLTNNYLNADEFEHKTHGKQILAYAPEDTLRAFREEKRFLLRQIEMNEFARFDSRHHGDLTVTSLPVAHGRSDTFGFSVTDTSTGERLVYAPDMAGWVGSPGEEIVDVDALVVEGAEIVGPELHGRTENVERAIERVDVVDESVYLVNVSEHTAELHTSELIEAGQPYNVVPDFTSVL